VETRVAAERWARIWERAWADHDAAAVSSLYRPDASFRSHPFRDPEDPRAFVARVFADEESSEPSFQAPVVDGDRVVVEWKATSRLRDGSEENLVGVSLLRFDSDGLVQEQRDIWCGGST
jgi:nuclear transport factor 2 (NTF2) superfamily protein